MSTPNQTPAPTGKSTAPKTPRPTVKLTASEAAAFSQIVQLYKNGA